MRTPPQRREDGKFGVGESVTVTKEKRDTRFQKGAPRPANAGRQKGTPNKLSAEVKARLEALGCDPVEGLVKIAQDENERTDLRARCYSDLLPYVYPKKAQIDVNQKIDPEIFASKVKGAQEALVKAKQESENRQQPRPTAPATEEVDVSKLSDEELDRFINEPES